MSQIKLLLLIGNKSRRQIYLDAGNRKGSALQLTECHGIGVAPGCILKILRDAISRDSDVTPFIGPVLMRVGGRDHAAAPC